MASTERIAVRVWVPDRPGSLAQLATRIAGAGGNVIGLEVLERDSSAALDELLIEVESADVIDHLCSQVASIAGARIEEVRPVAPDAEEHGLRVADGALRILTQARPAAALSALVSVVSELFDSDWCALVSTSDGTVAHSVGSVPPHTTPAQLLGGRGPTGTRLSEVMVTPVEEAHLNLVVGRPIPFRHRERREIEMLVSVTDRMCRSGRGDRIPREWGMRGGFPGT